MAAGQPLNDADRAPWLDCCAAALAAGPVVLSFLAIAAGYAKKDTGKANVNIGATMSF